MALNSPVGTSELLPFGTNLDLLWDWIFLEILLGDSSLLPPVGIYYAFIFMGKYVYLVEVVCHDGRKVLCEMVNDHVVGEATDHDDI